MNTELLAWLADRTDAQTLAVIAAAVLIGTQMVKGILQRIPRFPADFADWWIVAALFGLGLGLGLIEASVAGATAGCLIAVFASGAFEWIGRAGAFLKPAAAGDPPASNLKSAILVLIALSAALAVGGGCSIPEAVLRTAQYEQLQLDSDRALIERIFQDRAASNDALIRGLDTAFEQAVKGRTTLDAAWVLETVRGNEALKALLRSRQRQDEIARQTILDNFDKRKDALGRAGELAIRSQAWSSETAELVRDLLAETLKVPAETPLAPVGEVAPTGAANAAAAAPADSK